MDAVVPVGAVVMPQPWSPLFYALPRGHQAVGCAPQCC